MGGCAGPPRDDAKAQSDGRRSCAGCSRRVGSAPGERAKAVRYLSERRGQMDYGEYRSRGLLIGSGHVEAACKTVVRRRMKCTCMRWTVAGAKPMLRVRCPLERLVRRPLRTPPQAGRETLVITHLGFVAHPNYPC